jgi:uncharacterized protein (TIGR00725 family)
MSRVAVFGLRGGIPHLLLARGEGGFRLLDEAEQPYPELRLRRGGGEGDDPPLLFGQLPGELLVEQPPPGRAWHRWDSMPSPLEAPAEVAAARRLATRLGGRQWICAVVGCKDTSARFTPAVSEDAFRAGRIAAELGFAVLTGGLGGVMSRAAEGAASVGGMTIGILPGDRHEDSNPHVRFVLPSGIGYARNYLTAVASDVMIALPGGTGTLEEICFAVDFGRPVLSWGSWELPETTRVAPGDAADLSRALCGVMNRKFEGRTT